MTDEAIIRMEGAAFAFEDGGELFSGLTREFRAGSFTLVRGPSGAGKSTLLRLLCRLEEPTAGKLYFEGRPYGRWPAPNLRRKITYLQQTPAVIAGGVRENLLLPFTFKANRELEPPGDDRLESGLEKLMMGGVGLDRAAGTLSVGQKQRLCLLRAMLLKPRVLLLDEPTSALDAQSARVVEDAAEDFCAGGENAVVMISHGDFEPKRIEPEVLEIREGEAGAA
jgi:putative ABC transport system ATP-binding protein